MKLSVYEEYSEKVNQLFSNLMIEVNEVLAAAIVEHIGSTSVKGAVSKGDLDAMVVVDKTEFQDAIKGIESLGYHQKKETLRTDEICSLTTDKYCYDVAIQLVVKESAWFDNFMKFRRMMAEDPSFLEAYNQVKILAADLSEAEYRVRKSKFLKKHFDILSESTKFYNKLFWDSESRLFGKLNADKPQVAMWYGFCENPIPESKLELVPVDSESLWQKLFELRKLIEVEFGITNEKVVQGVLDEMKSLADKHEASWYLASYNGECVGSIGLVELEMNGVKYGRLLDVDILPKQQGQGRGNQLIHAILRLAQGKGLLGVGLKADQNRWVKDWYGRLGFIIVGLWRPGDEDVLASTQKVL